MEKHVDAYGSVWVTGVTCALERVDIASQHRQTFGPTFLNDERYIAPDIHKRKTDATLLLAAHRMLRRTQRKRRTEHIAAQMNR